MCRHTLSNPHRRKAVPVVLCFGLLFFFLLPPSLNAQFIPGGETILTLTPQSPQAGQEFEARVEAYTYDIARARISWSVDGAVREESEGEQEITLRAPALGAPLRIGVRVTEASGAVHAVSKTIVPSALDLIVESSTRVPHFYRGRALPSAGSAVRLIAFPSVYSPTGTRVSPANLLYTWRVGERVAKTGVGQNVLNTTMPLGGPMTIEVTVETADGSARHTSIKEIAAAEPQNLFYEDNPLHGLSQNALPAEFTLLEDEISIRAEPYFVSPDIFNNATYAWTINDAPVENPNADPQTLTLRKTGGKGSAQVAFSIRNLSSLLQAASSAFTVHFEN